jgi:hypothetical protein
MAGWHRCPTWSMCRAGRFALAALGPIDPTPRGITPRRLADLDLLHPLPLRPGRIHRSMSFRDRTGKQTGPWIGLGPGPRR